jgi:hypothetical protein
MLGEGQKMKLDTDPFPMNFNTINFKEKRVLVHTSQADTMRGKNVITSDGPRLKMIKARSSRLEEWHMNLPQQSKARVKPTSGTLLEKYADQ